MNSSELIILFAYPYYWGRVSTNVRIFRDYEDRGLTAVEFAAAPWVFAPLELA